MRNIGLLILFLGFQMTTWSQVNKPCNYTLAGFAYDRNTNQPLPYALIQIKNTETGVTTDEDGYFSISNLCEKEYDLIFSYLGYKTVEHHHDFHHPDVKVYLAPDDLLLESVVVESERIESGLSSITSNRISGEELKRVASENLGDILTQISGVSTLKTGQNVVKPVIHGLHSNRILVVNEGLRHEFQNWGTEHAPEIDPSLIESLEVIKGAAAVRYGSDAMGGVILIKAPKIELSSPFRVDISTTGKSNGRSGESTVQLQKGFKWLSLMAGGSILKQGDLHAPNYQLTNTGKRERSYNGGILIHPLPELNIEGYYSHFSQELGILRGSVNGNLDDLLRGLSADIPNFTEPFSYDINTPKQGVAHDLYKAKATWKTKRQSFLVQYGHQLNKRKEFDVRRGTNNEVPNIDLELLTETIDAEWVHPSFAGFFGRIGYQWMKQANDNLPGTNTVPFIPNYDQKRQGVYWIESMEIGDHLFEFGARYDWMEAQIVGRQSNNNIYRNEIAYENFTATLGYQYKIKDNQTFRTNIGSAWRPPNIAELYRFGRHGSFLEYGLWRYQINQQRDLISTQRILNQDDKPVPSEIGYKWISTYNWQKNGAQLEITGYINYIENYINARPAGLTRTVRGTSPFFIYQQNTALIWGIDAAAQWKHNHQLMSTFRSSYVWAKDIVADDFFVDIPPIAMNHQLDFTPKLPVQFISSMRFSLFNLYTFQQTQHPRILTVDEVINAFRTGLKLFTENAKNFDIAPPPPAYWLTHISWETQIKKFSWQFQVQNLFNVSYRTYTDRLRYFADDLGRNFILTLRYQL
jgi:iron complex outermembrane receptor protein